MLAKQPDAYRHQDTQAMFSPGPGKLPHAKFQWKRRAPEEFEDYPVLMAWREGVTVHKSDRSYARFHEPSGMMLYAEYGFIATVVCVEEADGGAPEIVRKYKEGMVNEE